MPTPTVAESYALCQAIARRTAGNFYYAFLALPRAKRLGMCALYAFLRRSDDLVDTATAVAERRAALEQWREGLRRALSRDYSDPILPALVHTVRHYAIPLDCLFDALDGVQMDLDVRQYETFPDLALYCHKVASVVGLACIHIWGFSGSEALEPARRCGIAFQLTNILRDLKEDADNGRIYLPQEDLRRFRYGPDELARGICDDRFRQLMRFQLARAEEYYRAGEELLPMLSADGRVAFGVMLHIYRGLLHRIRKLDGDVFSRRVRLSMGHKIVLAIRGWFHGRWPALELRG